MRFAARSCATSFASFSLTSACLIASSPSYNGFLHTCPTNLKKESESPSLPFSIHFTFAGLYYAVKYRLPTFIGSDGAGAEASTFRQNVAGTQLLSTAFFELTTTPKNRKLNFQDETIARGKGRLDGEGYESFMRTKPPNPAKLAARFNGWKEWYARLRSDKQAADQAVKAEMEKGALKIGNALPLKTPPAPLPPPGASAAALALANANANATSTSVSGSNSTSASASSSAPTSTPLPKLKPPTGVLLPPPSMPKKKSEPHPDEERWFLYREVVDAAKERQTKEDDAMFAYIK